MKDLQDLPNWKTFKILKSVNGKIQALWELDLNFFYQTDPESRSFLLDGSRKIQNPDPFLQDGSGILILFNQMDPESRPYIPGISWILSLFYQTYYLESRSFFLKKTNLEFRPYLPDVSRIWVLFYQIDPEFRFFSTRWIQNPC